MYTYVSVFFDGASLGVLLPTLFILFLSSIKCGIFGEGEELRKKAIELGYAKWIVKDGKKYFKWEDPEKKENDED